MASHMLFMRRPAWPVTLAVAVARAPGSVRTVSMRAATAARAVACAAGSAASSSVPAKSRAAVALALAATGAASGPVATFTKKSSGRTAGLRPSTTTILRSVPMLSGSTSAKLPTSARSVNRPPPGVASARPTARGEPSVSMTAIQIWSPGHAPVCNIERSMVVKVNVPVPNCRTMW